MPPFSSLLVVLLLALMMVVSRGQSQQSSHQDSREKQQLLYEKLRKDQEKKRKAQGTQNQRDLNNYNIEQSQKAAALAALDQKYFLNLQTAQYPVPSLQSNDSLLFLGYSNTMHGTLQSHGFINIFLGQLLSIYPNISSINIGVPHDPSTHKTDSFISVISDLLHNNVKPISKAIFIVEHELFTADPALTDQSDEECLSHVKHVIAYFKRINIPIIVTGFLLYGEKYDSTNPFDNKFEVLNGDLRQISREFEVPFIDLSMPLQKHLEVLNHENLEYGSLTQDGKVLNEEGHEFLAIQLFKAFNPKSSFPTSIDNSIVKSNTITDETKSISKLAQRLNDNELMSLNLRKVEAQITEVQNQFGEGF